MEGQLRFSQKAADELASAIRAALDIDGGIADRARARMPVEDKPGMITVTIRDDGPACG